MKLKQVIPNMEGTFGKLEFAGVGKIKTKRINGREVVISRTYNLFSLVQKADNIAVKIPGKAGDKEFGYEEKVKLVNPKILAEGKIAEGRGYVNYLLEADDIVKAE